jgi:hypothetical protein
MFQLGAEKEGKYFLRLNFAKGKDIPSSSNPPPLTIKPQEGFVMSLVSDMYYKKWYLKAEVARSTFTRTSPRR